MLYHVSQRYISFHHTVIVLEQLKEYVGVVWVTFMASRSYRFTKSAYFLQNLF